MPGSVLLAGLFHRPRQLHHRIVCPIVDRCRVGNNAADRRGQPDLGAGVALGGVGNRSQDSVELDEPVARKILVKDADEEPVHRAEPGIR